MTEKIKIGISGCLTGMKVRFDGQGLRPQLINELFSEFFDYVTFCPEVEMGMSIPRETIRLEKQEEEVRLVAPKSNTDHTDGMKTFADNKVAALAELDISGYIVKRGSPSCGFERIKIYNKDKIPAMNGVGMFTEKLIERFPLLPIEDEGRLNDIRLREHWVERVYAYERLKAFLRLKPSRGDIVKFHTNSKMQLMAHHPVKYRQLGKDVAEQHKQVTDEFLVHYENSYMEIMKHQASVKKHADVLYHLMGFFKKDIDSSEKQELVEVIEKYRTGMIPLVTPLTLINHYIKKYPVQWVCDQTYLTPYPEELLLRSYM